MNEEERCLWKTSDLECVMISCCAGAELQIRRLEAAPGERGPGAIVLRELYPSKSDLYERALGLQESYGGTAQTGRRR